MTTKMKNMKMKILMTIHTAMSTTVITTKTMKMTTNESLAI